MSMYIDIKLLQSPEVWRALIAHQRNGSGCLCGKDVLGQSHAEHIQHELVKVLASQAQENLVDSLGAEVEVKREWGFRYPLPNNKHKFTEVAICTRAQALQIVRDLQSYAGTDVTVEIVTRVVMTSDWKPQDLDELAKQLVAEAVK